MCGVEIGKGEKVMEKRGRRVRLAKCVCVCVIV